MRRPTREQEMIRIPLSLIVPLLERYLTLAEQYEQILDSQEVEVCHVPWSEDKVPLSDVHVSLPTPGTQLPPECQTRGL